MNDESIFYPWNYLSHYKHLAENLVAQRHDTRNTYQFSTPRSVHLEAIALVSQHHTSTTCSETSSFSDRSYMITILVFKDGHYREVPLLHCQCKLIQLRLTHQQSFGRRWHCNVYLLHHSYTNRHSQTLAVCC